VSKLTYGILASGGLGHTCLKNIIARCNVSFVFTDKQSTAIIELCNDLHIPVFIGNPRKGKATDFLQHVSVDAILSVNYLFIVENDVISCATKYAINFHGSLLPKYRGRTPHVWAIINNEKYTGITAHLITGGCDEGDIVYQEIIEIDQNATGGMLLDRYKERFPVIIDHVIDLLEEDRISRTPQMDTLATYFGKRTAEDGQICWEWQKERIRNWVRAQARPYPGAFTFYEGERLIIHAISYSDLGFSQDDANGLILEIEPQIVVKTNNGAIILNEIEMPHTIKLKKGNLFHVSDANK